MLILDIIFDYVLFLSKKEIYKERKFSFLSYQNLRFWGKMIRAELAQLIILDKNAMKCICNAFIRNFEEISRRETKSREEKHCFSLKLRQDMPISSKFRAFFEKMHHFRGLLTENGTFSCGCINFTRNYRFIEIISK